MKKYFVLCAAVSVLSVFFYGCRNQAKNKTGSGESSLKKAYPLITAIPAGKTKVIVGKSAPYADPADLDTNGCFLSGRTVILSGFEIGKYEVSYKLWHDVRVKAEKEMGYIFENKGMQGAETGGGTWPEFQNIDKAPAAPSSNPPDDTDVVNYLHPVTMVSWRDAVVWCNAYSEIIGLEPVYYYGDAVLKDSSKNKGLSIFNYYDCDACGMRRDKNGYRLPTEAEWEFAARGGDPFISEVWGYKYSGSNNLENVGWMEANSKERTHECGRKSSNTLGLFDMTGNVDEWCWDIYDENPAESDEKYKISGIVTNPSGKILENTQAEDYHSIKRIYKGGKFEASNDFGVVTLRKHFEPGTRNNGLGFRICRTLN